MEGLNKSFFTTLSVLNEKNTSLYCILFLVIFFCLGGFIPLILSSMIALFVSVIVQRFILNKRIAPPKDSAVIITGCSSGMGKDAALQFAKLGVTVFATFRKMEDYENVVKAASNQDLTQRIVPIILDVTKKDSIETGVAQINSKLNGKSLLGLINNAGFGQTSMMELSTDEKMRYQFDVNVFGVIHMSNAVLPLLRTNRPAECNPKIVNVSSIISRFSSVTTGLYAGTKHALEAITASQRVELAAQKIDVVSLQPGLIATNFASTLKSQSIKADTTSPITDVEQYYAAAQTALDAADKGNVGAPTTVVIDAMTDIIFSTKPHPIYVAGVDAQILGNLLPWLWPSALDNLTTSLFKPLSSFKAVQKKE